MSLYFFNNVPAEYLDKFCAVRDAFSNLENLLGIKKQRISIY